ncbi:MAG: hypothetical protein JXN64_12120 [Spirochaetes bacterium]|nr:hypothetical protein [Spirochaetota bacterium]
MNDFLGYTDQNYAYSLSEFGQPQELPNCKGWILIREIPDTSLKDAMGCYPIFTCKNWFKLHEDLSLIDKNVISLSLIIDPLADIGIQYLKQHFHLVRPFKSHFIADLNQPLQKFVSKSHMKNVRKSLKKIDVEICTELAQYHEDWIRLYDVLKKRHNINGINAFSHRSFKIQLNIPGMIMFIARQQGNIIGALLLLVNDNVGYIHLSAFSDEGYEIKASYGITWKALEYLQEKGIHFALLGSMAGIKNNLQDGLALFKKGWSNEIRQNYLCGYIFDQQKYESLCHRNRINNTDYFPAYRG